MPDNKQEIPDDPFDIRDEIMEIDDALNTEDAPADALETSPESDGSNWQSELVRKASEAGMPKEIIAKLQGADAVNDLVSIIANAVQKQAIIPEEPEKKPKNDFELEIDEDTAFDPDAARAIKKMHAYYETKIRELETKFSENSSKQVSDSLPSFVKTLGDEWQPVFGTDEKPNTSNLKRLEESVQTIRAGYTARHRRIPAESELLKMALNASFSDKQKEIARSEFAGKVEKRSNQIVSRPGTRTASSSNPRMRAAQGVADWFKSRGIDPYSTAQEDFQ
jgi:hypothetical protein